MLSSLRSGFSLFEVLFVLHLVRVPASVSSSLSSASPTVIFDASPLAPSAAFDLVLGRLLDTLAESVEATDFLCLTPLVIAWDAESAASSPEASREEGWRRSAVEDFLIEFW